MLWGLEILTQVIRIDYARILLSYSHNSDKLFLSTWMVRFAFSVVFLSSYHKCQPNEDG